MSEAPSHALAGMIDLLSQLKESADRREVSASASTATQKPAAQSAPRTPTRLQVRRPAQVASAPAVVNEEQTSQGRPAQPIFGSRQIRRPSWLPPKED